MLQLVHQNMRIRIKYKTHTVKQYEKLLLGICLLLQLKIKNNKSFSRLTTVVGYTELKMLKMFKAVLNAALNIFNIFNILNSV